MDLMKFKIRAIYHMEAIIIYMRVYFSGIGGSKQASADYDEEIDICHKNRRVTIF